MDPLSFCIGLVVGVAFTAACWLGSVAIADLFSTWGDRP